jgi:imidazolonepropionase-like amidohydrolase
LGTDITLNLQIFLFLPALPYNSFICKCFCFKTFNYFHTPITSIMKKLFLVTFSLAVGLITIAQQTFPVNGVKDSRELIYHAFINANIVADPVTIYGNSTLLVRNGVIEQVGQKITIPQGAVVHDLEGKFIYPSMIDLYSSYGMPEVSGEARRGRSGGPQPESLQKGPYNWNEAIRPDKRASGMFSHNKKEADELRKLGFGTVLTHQFDGIARGTSALVALADASENESVLKGEAAAHYSFSKGTSTQDYPSSLMGVISLLRQTYLDAQWYKSSPSDKREYNISLDEWNRTQNLPQIFEVTDKLSALRADKIGDEFKVQYIIKGRGDEYQRVQDVRNTNAPLIIPVAFPAAYEVEDPLDARMISLADLKHWEMAPSNAAILAKSKIDFAFTLADLKEKNDFWKNIRKAIQNGLPQNEALRALTLTPAKLIGMEQKVGALKPGMIANFIITSDSLFSDKNIIYENWVLGKQYKYQDRALEDIRGEYSLNVGGDRIYKLKIAGEASAPTAEVTVKDTVAKKGTISRTGELITLSFETEDKGIKGFTRLSGKINYRSGIWDGKGQLANGDWIDWSAIKKGKSETKALRDTVAKPAAERGTVLFPFTAYGSSEIPRQQNFLIKGATVWTNENEGKIQADVLIRNGKIAAIGNNLDTSGNRVIDGAGKHLTPGIIDEHSHIAISRGVNEGGQAISSEVRIGDVVNNEDINIYRQLSGGVTAAQLLHGSANPIGGQSALVKLKWGVAPEQMKIDGAPGFIKFALGENVKQANWGDRHVIRFPQTRMGVEQVFYDAFTRAKEYERSFSTFNSLTGKAKERAIAPRKDLELEALVEILNKKRFISCHSYVQSEINMLMHVGDSMGFKVNTFTHILEGYKVADKMKAHGAGGSTFSDWWAYKYEVHDAIPYNAAMMNNMGIVTAINSDDAEMGRRLNQEAAKAIKYGGVSEEEALKMVTLNPAKLLHLDTRTGSVKTGKDADLVLWSDNPLSIYAKAEKTFVDGVLYFDRQADLMKREEIRTERARLINKMIEAKKSGERTQKPDIKKERFYHCNTIGEHGAEGHEHNDH